MQSQAAERCRTNACSAPFEVLRELYPAPDRPGVVPLVPGRRPPRIAAAARPPAWLLHNRQHSVHLLGHCRIANNLGLIGLCCDCSVPCDRSQLALPLQQACQLLCCKAVCCMQMASRSVHLSTATIFKLTRCHESWLFIHMVCRGRSTPGQHDDAASAEGPPAVLEGCPARDTATRHPEVPRSSIPRPPHTAACTVHASTHL